MPWKRDTIQEIQERLEGNLISSLNLEQGQRHSLINILSKTFAGAIHGLHGYGDYLAKQISPLTAEQEYLEKHARIYGIERKTAQKSIGTVTFTGSDGSFFPEKTEMVANGIVFISLNAATAENGMVQINVESKEFGLHNNVSANTQIKLVSPVVGFLPDGKILEDINGGSDAESDENLLERLTVKLQSTPTGGSTSDFLSWVLDIDKHGVDIVNAWIFPREMGLGTVTVRFLTGAGIPSIEECEKVKEYIETVQPITCTAFVVPPVAKPITFKISGLNPATAEVRKNIDNSLRSFLLSKVRPGETILLSHISEAISTTQLEIDHILDAPTENIKLRKGEIATFGSIEWK